MGSQLRNNYLPRVAEQNLSEMLETFGGVLVQGARGVGKSRMSMVHGRSGVRIDADPLNIQLAQTSPETVLMGESPRVIDEWQLAPELWNAARHLIDDRHEPGQFIFTGSASPTESTTRHSGAGRFGTIQLRPMSLAESRESTAQVSLSSLMSGSTAAGIGGPTVPEYAELLARGGWPALVTGTARNPQLYLEQYLESVARVDLLGEDWAADPARMFQLLRSIARNTSTEIAKTKLAAEADLGTVTLDRYLNALRRIFILEEQHAWAVKLRSKVRTRVKPKWHLADPSLAVTALGADSSALLKDLETFGLLFESMVIRDLRVYAAVMGASVTHYRDETGLEVDAIVQKRNGSWAAFEIKIGGTDAIDKAATNLRTLADKVDHSVNGEPLALGVITAGNNSFTRPDGVHVLSLGHLAP